MIRSDTDTSTEEDQFDANSKLKRSLCRNFVEKGFCPYGRKCQFAHGLSELKINTTQNNLYKTKTCFSFQRKGFCIYGIRCNFIHTQEPSPYQWEGYRDVIYGGRGSKVIKLLFDAL